MKKFFTKKLFGPLLDLLKQGITPSKLSLAISLGIVLATVPVFGLSSVLCLLAIWLFRVNPAAIFLVNQFAYPLQFLCYLPLIRVGEWLFQKQPIPFSVGEIFEMLIATPLQAISLLWWSTIQALIVWILLMIPITFVLQQSLKALLAKVIRREMHPL